MGEEDKKMVSAWLCLLLCAIEKHENNFISDGLAKKILSNMENIGAVYSRANSFFSKYGNTKLLAADLSDHLQSPHVHV